MASASSALKDIIQLQKIYNASLALRILILDLRPLLVHHALLSTLRLR